MTTESSLRMIREDELGVSREKLAIRAGGDVCVSTIRNAELARRLTIGKAQRILDAINALLVEAQKPTIGLDDLKINLY